MTFGVETDTFGVENGRGQREGKPKSVKGRDPGNVDGSRPYEEGREGPRLGNSRLTVEDPTQIHPEVDTGDGGA